MSYASTEIIECMRATSEEAKASLTTQHNALYTNKLGQAIKLEVGDTVQVERVFINGLGAGNPNTIQFTGVIQRPKRNKTQKYTKIVGSHYQDDLLTTPYRMGYYLKYEVTEIETPPLTIKDNEVTISTGYYLNSCNHPSYIQLPRRFSMSNPYEITDAHKSWVDRDTHLEGLGFYSINPDCYVYDDWRQALADDGETLYKQRIDNSRYTLYLRDKQFYAIKTTTAGADKQLDGAGYSVQNVLFPSSATYLRYREQQTIKVNKGFNTAESVAEQIKLQLNQADDPQIFEVLDATDSTIKKSLTSTITAKTYKPSNVASITEFSKGGYEKFIDTAIVIDNESVVYDAQFYTIGVKRPEIWEAGRDLMDTLVPDRFEGFNLLYSMKKSLSSVGQYHLTMLWNKENLDKLKALFDTQALYPELWKNLNLMPDYKVNERERPTIDNSRFLHMANYGHVAGQAAKVPYVEPYFGSDGMNKLKTLNNPATKPAFFTYDDSQRDFYLGLESLTKINVSQWNQYAFVYGFAQPYEAYDKFYIRLDTKALGGVPHSFYTGIHPTEGANAAIWGSLDLPFGPQGELIGGRYIGYDRSFTAYSTACILPYANHTEATFEGSSVNKPHAYTAVVAKTGGIQTTVQYFTQAYIGANNPIIDYVDNRFEISQLHIAENVGNAYNAGDMGSGAIVPPPINDDAGDIVYKINPRIGYDGYSPTFKPYVTDRSFQFADPLPADGYEYQSYQPPFTPTETGVKITAFQTATVNSFGARDISISNENIEPYKIFDSTGGIYIDDWGYNIEEWESSLWGIMGFSYEQMNSTISSSNVLNNRISERNKYNLRWATTNSEVDTTDTKAFIVNLYGAPLYTTQIGSSKVIQGQQWTWVNSGGVIGTPEWVPKTGYLSQYYPALTQKTNSISLVARNLPKQMINPFYTIRTNILGATHYIGSKDSGMRLPVCALIDRYGAQGDYFFGSPSDLSFTITKQNVIGDIETAICNPDGSYADIDPNSGVIYKIIKQMPAPQNIIEQILQSENKK